VRRKHDNVKQNVSRRKEKIAEVNENKHSPNTVLEATNSGEKIQKSVSNPAQREREDKRCQQHAQRAV